jgi:hypothetical protein
MPAAPIPISKAATITTESFWPIVALPGADGAISLLPPSRTNGTLMAPQPRRLREIKAGIGVIPVASTCAIVLYGTDEYNQKVDLQNLSDLSQNNLGIENTFSNKDANGKLQPAGIVDLQASISQSIQKGCKKLYLYISSHGGEAAGDEKHSGWQLSFRPHRVSGEVERRDHKQRLTFDSLSNILKPLKDSQTELCLIVDACFAANAIPAMQNFGISGLVVIASDRGSFSSANYFSVFSGGYFTDGLFTVWKSLAPSETNQVGLGTAMASLQAKGSGLFLTENPLSGNSQIATIDPNGGIFPASDLKTPLAQFQAMVTGNPAPACPTGIIRVDVKGTVSSDLDDSARFVGPIDGLHRERKRHSGERPVIYSVTGTVR